MNFREANHFFDGHPLSERSGDDRTDSVAVRLKKLLSFAVLLLLVHGCSRSEANWRPDTSWHTEEITKETTSFGGLYQSATNNDKSKWWNQIGTPVNLDAIDVLRVRSHAWKLIALRGTNECEWGFKVVIEFPEPNFKSKNFEVPFMPIKELEYQLFDRDGFQLTKLVLDDSGLRISAKETNTFQHSGLMPKDLARRAAYGRLNIKAGPGINAFHEKK